MIGSFSTAVKSVFGIFVPSAVRCRTALHFLVSLNRGHACSYKFYSTVNVDIAGLNASVSRYFCPAFVALKIEIEKTLRRFKASGAR